jgi:phosphoribosylformylglycinamidine synthase
MPNALIITAAGINCDVELARAFESAGAQPELRHLNELRRDPALMDRFDLIGVPGGFSYGDSIAAGRIAAALMRQSLYAPLVRAIERGVPIIAPCNGFQILVQVGLLPGPGIGEPWPPEPPQPTVALATNAKARFADQWSRVEVPANTRCIWTRGLRMTGDAAMLPSAHGEGRFIAESPAVIRELDRNGQIALRYVRDDNFNGSMDCIAGICDASGLVFGLMPHPERYTRWTQHPFWTRLSGDAVKDDTLGLQMFRNAVLHAAAARTAV